MGRLLLLDESPFRKTRFQFRMDRGTGFLSVERIPAEEDAQTMPRENDRDLTREEEERRERARQKGTFLLVTQLGLTMVGSILFCFAIGYYLDKWLGTKVVFITIFIVLGVVGGGYTAYRQIMETTPPDKKSKGNQ